MQKPQKKAKKVPQEVKYEFPMRLNRYLAINGKASRRMADKMIEHKWIKINGRFAVLGDKVNENDEVEILQGKNKRGQ